MYILYIDESGTINSNDIYILSGLIVSKQQSLEIEKLLNQQIELLRFNNVDNIEIHAQHIKTGKGVWRHISKNVRSTFLEICLGIVKNNRNSQTLSSRLNSDKDGMMTMYYELIHLFNQFLIENNSYGVVVCDKCSFELEIQQNFKLINYEKILERPLFMDSKASRCLQAADILAYEHKEQFFIK